MTDGLDGDVLAGCAQTRCTEVDDIHLASCTTPGSVVVSTVLALAAAGDLRSVGDVCAAALAGFESLIRFGVAIDGPTAIGKGVWPTHAAAAFGSAAVACRAYGLSVDQTAGALATALALGRALRFPRRSLVVAMDDAGPGRGQRRGRRQSRARGTVRHGRSRRPGAAIDQRPRTPIPVRRHRHEAVPDRAARPRRHRGRASSSPTPGGSIRPASTRSSCTCRSRSARSSIAPRCRRRGSRPSSACSIRSRWP